MNYTQNLHLPQWVASDRIHHDDFNDAFGRIDTAVGTNAAAIAAGKHIFPLYDTTTTSDTTQIDVPLSTLHPENYDFTAVLLEAGSGTSFSAGTVLVHIRADNQTSGYGLQNSAGVATNANEMGRIHFGGLAILRQRPGESNTHCRSFYFGDEGEFVANNGYVAKTLRNIGSLNLVMTSSINAKFKSGTRVRVFGCKL